MAFCDESGDRLGPAFGSDDPIDYDKLPDSGHIAYPGVADRIDAADKPLLTEHKITRRVMDQAIDMDDVTTANEAAERLKRDN